MKPVAMICGSYPPDACGIGHYFYHLLFGLSRSSAITVFLPQPPDVAYRVPGVDYRNYPLEVIPLIRRHKIRILHWQLISQGFRYSMVFLLMMLYLRIRFPRLIQLVTLHDFSSLHPINRLRLLSAAIICQGVIVTVEKEKPGLRAFQPNLYRIPIASNISLDRHWQPPIQYHPLKLVMWGFPTRTRNVVAILVALDHLRRINPDFSLTFIPGWLNISESQAAVYHRIIRQYQLESHIMTTGYLGETEMTEILLKSHLSLLIFTDGLSFRRTSFIGTAGLGLPFIASCGPSTDPWLSHHLTHSVIRDQNPASICQKIIEFLRRPEEFIKESRSTADYISRHHSWYAISKKHLSLYHNL